MGTHCSSHHHPAPAHLQLQPTVADALHHLHPHKQGSGCHGCVQVQYPLAPKPAPACQPPLTCLPLHTLLATSWLDTLMPSDTRKVCVASPTTDTSGAVPALTLDQPKVVVSLRPNQPVTVRARV